MTRRKLHPYQCCRCGYESQRRSCILFHFNDLKKPCPATKQPIDLTDEIKEYILDNRIYNPDAKTPYTQRLEIENAILKNRKTEDIYQTALEKYLHGTHKRLKCGITDITTSIFHAEIKEWQGWKGALGQLVSYNQEDPRQELRAYFFGKVNKKTKQVALEVLEAVNIRAFEVDFTDVEHMSILNLHTGSEESVQILA